MTTDLWWQFIRDILKIVGAMLVARGIITADTSTLLYGDAVVGAIIALGAVVWGYYVRWRTKSVSVATVNRENLSTVSTATGGRVAPPGPPEWKSKE